MDYEKAYKEALEKAKIFRQRWEGIEINSELALKELKEIFPELSESKDKKIINAIKQMYSFLQNKPEYIGSVPVKDIIAWLDEKSNNEIKLPSDFREAVYKVANFISTSTDSSDFNKTVNSFAEQLLTLAKNELPKFRVGDTICMISEEVPYPRTIEKIENGNYIYDNGKGFISLKFQDNYELLKQEPILNQSSAEKLRLMKKCVHLAFKQGYKSGLQTANAEWEHKTTWSEEDTIRLNQAVYVLHQQGYSDVENWLKNLNPQKINVESEPTSLVGD